MPDAQSSGYDATQVQRQKLYEDRWSSYGTNPDIINISEKLSPGDLKRFDLFEDYGDRFLEKLTPDVSVVRWKAGSVLFEEGSYLDLAFYIVEGEVDLFLRKHRETKGDTGSQPIFKTRYEGGDGAPASGAGADPGETVFQAQVEAQPAKKRKKQKSEDITYLSSMDFDLPEGETLRLGPGDVFGEIGALNGWPQSVTARTASECTVVQIRLPALRNMKKKSKGFKEHLDQIYRERTLFNQLSTTPLFRGVDESFIEALGERVELVSCAPEDVLTQEGEPTDALYLVRSGFLKLGQNVAGSDIVVTYLSKGMTLGEVELLVDGVERWQYTTTSVGYSELVKISRDDFFEVIKRYPAVERRLWQAAVARVRESGNTKRNPDKSDLIEFSLAKGLVQGNSILVIDLDVCTRCDDCVRGCANTHGGRPRFVREGEKYENFLVTRSCYHCEDPVCLIGCPTGAIHRANVGEVVEIDDNLCIGCSNCANKCPYDAIIMHDTGETWSETAIPKWLRGRDRQVASKCNLCHDAEQGPACVNNCPHSCAFRINSIEEFQQLLEVDYAQR